MCLIIALFARIFRTRRDLVLENLALRRQLGVLKRSHPRSRLTASDKVVRMRQRPLWPGRKRSLILVRPRPSHSETKLILPADRILPRDSTIEGLDQFPLLDFAGNSFIFCWSGRRDSNPRPSAPKADALPGCATPRRSVSIVSRIGFTFRRRLCPSGHGQPDGLIRCYNRKGIWRL